MIKLHYYRYIVYHILLFFATLKFQNFKKGIEKRAGKYF